MTDQEIQDQAYDCGFYRTTPPCLAHLTDDQKEIWDRWFAEGQTDERDEAASAIADYHVMGSVYGYD